MVGASECVIECGQWVAAGVYFKIVRVLQGFLMI
jgi:hypothetical protein